MKHTLLFTLTALLLTAMTSFCDLPGVPARTWPVMAGDSVKIDPESGLVADLNLTLVKAQCTGCHSAKLISQHRFTRAGWTERIRWMQQYHKLWDLGETEKPVLDYLTAHYGPTPARAQGRRAPLTGIKWHPLR